MNSRQRHPHGDSGGRRVSNERDLLAVRVRGGFTVLVDEANLWDFVRP
jgi:hypothetical protein